MNITKPLHPLQIKAFRQMTPSEKHHMYLGMLKFAYQVKRNAIREEHPDWEDDVIDNTVAKIIMHGYI